MEAIETQPELVVEEQPAVGFFNKVKTYKFKILGGVLGVLVFAGAVFGIYKYAQNQIPLEPVEGPTPSLEATPTPDPTANWETYTNTKLNFLIKYPNEWAVDDSDTGPIEKQINIIRFYQSQDQTNKTLDVLMITMYIQDNIRDVSLIDLEKNLEEVKTFGYDNILGIKGYDKQYLKENHKVYVADIIKNNLIYTLTTGSRVISDDDIETFNLILSTFRFD